MPNTLRRLIRICMAAAALAAGEARADHLGDEIAAIRERYCDMLKVVRFSLESEDARRVELSFTGVAIAPDGLLMVPVPPSLLDYPRGYIKNCELFRPGQPNEARPARLVGVNELFELAFVAPLAAATSQPCVDFSVAEELPPIGQPLVCLGLLDPTLAFRCSFEVARVGPAIGGDDFTLSGVPSDATGTLLLTPRSRLVGVARPPACGDEEFLARGSDDRSAGFIAQPQATRARSLRRAVAFAARERRDWPDPWVGVAGLQVADRDICEAYGLPPDEVALIVGAVVEGFPAAEAGIRAKDFIIRYEGARISRGATDEETIAAWTRRIKHLAVGDSVRLTIWRDGREQDLMVRLAEAPVSETRAERDFNLALGLSVRDLVFSDRFGRRLDRAQSGVVVARLVQSGPAETADLQEGDIIQKVDEQPVADIASYRRVIAEKLAARPSALVFSVRRGTSQQAIVRVELQPPAGKADLPD